MQHYIHKGVWLLYVVDFIFGCTAHISWTKSGHTQRPDTETWAVFHAAAPLSYNLLNPASLDKAHLWTVK